MARRTTKPALSLSSVLGLLLIGMVLFGLALFGSGCSSRKHEGPAGPQGLEGPTGPEGPQGPLGDDGQDGRNALVNVFDEPSGHNCEHGGVKISWGLDSDGDGELQEDEVDDESFVCNGEHGPQGLPGEPGENGASCTAADNGNGSVTITCPGSEPVTVYDGTDGQNAQDRGAPLLRITEEPPGENCMLGGNLIEIGFDEDGDGELSKGEITDAGYACMVPPSNSVCGNGTSETGEQCDGSDLNGASCSSLGYGGGTLTCSGACQLDTSWCVSVCGNGISEAGEQCDGSDLNGASCSSLGYGGGTLTCSNCTFDTVACTM